MPRAQAAAIRHGEMSNLMKAIGAEHFNLGELDEFLYDTPEVRLQIIEVIRRTRADLIFTHYSADYNLDHTTVSSLARHCAMQAPLPVIPTASPPLPQSPAVFMVEPHGAIHFPASHYVDISGHFEKKVELLLCHRSQEEAMRQALGTGLAEICRRLDGYRGELVGCRYAEGFVPMPGRGTIKPYSVLP